MLEDMQEKDEDLLMLQDEIQQLTERINMMNKEQSRQIGKIILKIALDIRKSYTSLFFRTYI